MKTKNIKVEKGYTITLPKNIIDELDLNAGDEVSVMKIDGKVILAKKDSEFSEWMAAYGSANEEYRDVLRKLAQ